MNNKVRNTYDSLSPLTWILKIFAMNCNVENESCPQAFYLTKTLLTMMIVGSLNILCLYFKFNYYFGNLSPSIRLTDCVQMIYDQFQFIVDLWVIYKYGRHLSIQYFKQYECIDLILGMTDYTKVKWKLARLLCFFISIWFVSSAFDFAAWSFLFGLITPTIYSIAYFYLFIKIMSTIDLTSHTMHIELRLRMMADLVQHYYSDSESLPVFVDNSICNENWLYPDACSRVQKLRSQGNPLKVLSKDDSNGILWLRRCYLLLTEQVEFINKMFGFRILLNSLSLLIDIIRFTNIAVRIIIGTQIEYNTHNIGYYPVVSSLARMLTCVAVLVSLVLHCENTYDQTDKIVRTIDHIIIIKNPSEKLRSSLLDLRALVIARPINFNLAKFFRIDFSFLISIASVSVTYTIILLQSMN